MLSPGLHTLLEIALRTSVVYCLVLVGIRLSGKREVGQMTPFDLTLLLLLSNSVQNAMTGPDTSLAGGAVAAATLLILNYLVAELAGTNRRFRKVIELNSHFPHEDRGTVFRGSPSKSGPTR